jgi:hypothetical protein
MWKIKEECLGEKETNLPNIHNFHYRCPYFVPDGTMQTGICTENTDVREVGFHPPLNEGVNCTELSPSVIVLWSVLK